MYTLYNSSCSSWFEATVQPNLLLFRSRHVDLVVALTEITQSDQNAVGPVSNGIICT